jgi:hypothetical protein
MSSHGDFKQGGQAVNVGLKKSDVFFRCTGDLLGRIFGSSYGFRYGNNRIGDGKLFGIHVRNGQNITIGCVICNDQIKEVDVLIADHQHFDNRNGDFKDAANLEKLLKFDVVDASAQDIVEGVTGDSGSFANVGVFDALIGAKLLDDLTQLDRVEMEFLQ